MPQYDIFAVDDDNVDVIVRAEFAPGQDDYSLLEVVNTLAQVLQRGLKANRFEELIALEVTPSYCMLRLRYYTDSKRRRLGVAESGYEEVLGNWFRQYVFATVDHVRKIEAHPFHVPDLTMVFNEPYPFDGDPAAHFTG